jgi:hypothetical protein
LTQQFDVTDVLVARRPAERMSREVFLRLKMTFSAEDRALYAVEFTWRGVEGTVDERPIGPAPPNHDPPLIVLLKHPELEVMGTA